MRSWKYTHPVKDIFAICLAFGSRDFLVMRPAYQLPQGAMPAMPAMPVAGAHGHVSSPHVVMRAPLPGYGSPTAQVHQAAGTESFMRSLLVDCLNI